MGLGETYLNKFKIGDYVYWRTLVRDSNYDEFTRESWGIIVDFTSETRATRLASRIVYYALILENKTGKTIPVLLHKIQKVETN